MEFWSVIQNKVGPVLWLLVISTVFSLLFFLPRPSFPLTITTTKEALTQSPFDISPDSNLTTIQMVQTPPTKQPFSSSSKPAPDHEEISQNTSLTMNGSNATSTSPKLLPGGVDEVCDISVGKWVEEPRRSVYTNLTCRTLPDDRNCAKYGKDQSFVQWRWQPDGCDLPRFEPEEFLDIVKGKKMAFIGDSLARNQMESLLCLLSQAETPRDISMDQFNRFRTWYFPSHNFTLMVMWTEFLVEGNERLTNGTPSGSFDVHLDKMNTQWTEKLPGLDYAVISGGNWFYRRNYLHQNNKLIGCVNCMEENLTDLGMKFAIRSALRAALEFISSCKGCEGLVTFLRTFTASHFEDGTWFSGGHCNRTQPLKEGEINSQELTWEIRNMQLEEMARMRRRERKVKGVKFGVLDVSKAMMFRADGHPGRRWTYGRKANDCLHWCLPGPIDMWSDVLLAALKKNLVHH